jgi:pyruvate kinase
MATQVLESLPKKGLPSRAEITDAAMGERAEYVMLNKGPYLCDAVAALDDILQRMQGHQTKKSAMLRNSRAGRAGCESIITGPSVIALISASGEINTWRPTVLPSPHLVRQRAIIYQWRI